MASSSCNADLEALLLSRYSWQYDGYFSALAAPSGLSGPNLSTKSSNEPNFSTILEEYLPSRVLNDFATEYVQEFFERVTCSLITQ